MNARLPPILLIAAALLGPATRPAAAVTVFQDDFDAYTAGSPLAGQGGWQGESADIRAPLVLPGGASSRVSGPAGLDGFNTAYHAFASLSELGVYTFTTLAYAASGAHNVAIGLHDDDLLSGDPTNTIRNAAIFNAEGGTTNRWFFIVLDAAGSPLFSVNTGQATGASYRFVTEIDGPNRTIRGLVKDLGGTTTLFTSSLYTAPVGFIAAIDSAFITHRNLYSVEFDALLLDQVSIVAEPERLVLALGAAALLARRWGR